MVSPLFSGCGDRAADDGHRAGAHPDLGDQAQRLPAIATQCPADLHDADPGESRESPCPLKSSGRAAAVAVKAGGCAWVAGPQYGCR